MLDNCELRIAPSWVFATVLVALSIWVSHPSIFILAGGGLALLIFEPTLRRRMVVVCTLWAISFLIAYMLLYRVTNENAGLATYWAPAFFHLDPIWIINAVFEFFVLASGLNQPVMFVLAIAGIIIGIRVLPQYKTSLLLAPIAITFVASILQKYPFNGRLLLFLLPGSMIIIGSGLIALISAIAGKR